MHQRVVQGVVRIWHCAPGGQPAGVVGAGVLVARRSVLTCAHVVVGALGLEDGADPPDDAAVTLDFPAGAPETFYRARVAVWWPRQPRAGGLCDVAGLELSADAPGEPLALRQHYTLGEAVGVYGFPVGRPGGLYAEGTAADALASGWVRLRGGEQAREFVRKGYSGGPVYTDAGVVGLLTEGDGTQRVREAVMIPTPTLLTAWPDLYTMTTTCPYQGLESFTEARARFFCGRSEVSARLAQTLRTARVPTVLAGASGSGKSSLVAAGIVPLLRRDEAERWETLTFTPGRDPFGALGHVLGSSRQAPADVADALRTGTLRLTDALAELASSRGPDARLLVCADQLEELFTLAEPEARTPFLTQLLAAQGEQVKLLLVVRTDFLDPLLEPPAAGALRRGVVHYLGGVESLREVIEGPLRGAGLGVLEPGLTERLLTDVALEPNPLPLLEFTLTQLWERHEAGRLTHRAYEALGGVREAVARYAQRTFDALTPGQQAGAKRLFVQLMQPGEEGLGTRRVARLPELGDDLRPLVAQLAGRRLLVTGRSPDRPDTVEVVHEALFVHWPLLREWVRESWSFRRWQEGLRAALRDWREGAEAEGFLLAGPRLGVAEGYLTAQRELLGPDERRFIERSLERRERQASEQAERFRREARTQRRAARVLAAALAVTLFVSAAAAWGWGRAGTQTRRAEAFNVRLRESNRDLTASRAPARRPAGPYRRRSRPAPCWRPRRRAPRTATPSWERFWR